MPSECCVCAVLCGLILFIPPFFTVFICVTPHPTGLHLGKQKHALQLLTNTASQQICVSVFSSCTRFFRQYSNLQSVHARIYFRLKEVCCISCKINYPAFKFQTSVTLSAVLCADLLSKAQGLWGRWSHLGQGIVRLETCHAETSRYLKQLLHSVMYFSWTKPAVTILVVSVYWIWNTTPWPRPRFGAFSA